MSYVCQLIFSRHDAGQAFKNLCYCDIIFFEGQCNMDIFLNQPIQFYSNNVTNLHHLTPHSTKAYQGVLHCT